MSKKKNTLKCLDEIKKIKNKKPTQKQIKEFNDFMKIGRLQEELERAMDQYNDETKSLYKNNKRLNFVLLDILMDYFEESNVCDIFKRYHDILNTL